MHRSLVGSVVGLLLMTSSVFAAADTTTATVTSEISAPAITWSHTDLAATANTPVVLEPPHRPLVLPFLYASSVLLQGYDAYATLTVLKHGGTEVNPLLKGIKSPTALIGLRAGLTAMSIIQAERMWKRDQRLGAVLTMVAVNGFMAMAAVHNYAVIERLNK